MEDTRPTTAIVLRRQPYREADSRVWLYTQDFGKLELIARGTQKPGSKLAGHLEPLTAAKVMVVFGKQRSYVGSAINDRCHANIKSDLPKLHFAGQALQIFDRLVKPEVEDQELYALLESYLGILDEDNLDNMERPPISRFYHFFIMKLLARLGYEPDLSQCLIGRHALGLGNNYFDFGRSGAVCSDCQRRDKASESYRAEQWLAVSDDCLKVLRFIFKNDFRELWRLRLESNLNDEFSVFSKTYLHSQLY